MAAHILWIDDDQTLADRVEPVLTHQGYQVERAEPCLNAIRGMLLDEPDLVILGIDPRKAGWQFCHQILTFREGLLLLLLSADYEEDRLKGLDLGAADCLVKAVGATELVARVEALLRRRRPAISHRRRSLFVDGDLEVDLERREVRLGGEPVALTPTEFRLLSCLVRHAGEVVPHEGLVAQVWGPDRDASTGLLKPHIRHLREKLEPEPGHPRRIVTRLREGYSLQRIGA